MVFIGLGPPGAIGGANIVTSPDEPAAANTARLQILAVIETTFASGLGILGHSIFPLSSLELSARRKH